MKSLVRVCRESKCQSTPRRGVPIKPDHFRDRRVYRGVSIATGEVVALKFISQESVASNPRNVANLQREIEAMQLVSGHPHTVGVKQVLLDVSKERKRRPGQFKKCILLVLEICGGGELFDYLMTCGKFEENLARTYFIQMMEALHYAHSKNVAHRDIKVCPNVSDVVLQVLRTYTFPSQPENLLIDNHLNLRVADWGRELGLCRSLAG